MELERKDYEQILKDAKEMLKQTLISEEVFRSTIAMAEDGIKKFPEEDKKQLNADSTGVKK